jgi:HAD superfamily hydrolase (TIGR01509 family)
VTSTPSLVIFDCDGVLVDSEPISIRLLVETLAGAGLILASEEVHDRFLGKSLATTRDILADHYGLTLGEDALAQMRRRLHAAFRTELRPIPHVAATLEALPCAFCVASSSQPERIELSLTVTGLWPFFEDRAFSATMVSRGKPAPDLFLYASRSLGYTPTACLVVEDSPAGVTAARSAGMRVVAFTGGSHATTERHRAEIAALAPDAIIDDMRDLLEVARRTN